MYRLTHFDDDWIAGGLIDAYLGHAHRHTLVLRFENVRVMHTPHAGALQRQIVVAGDFGVAVADPIDKLFDRIGEHGLRERRHRHLGIRAGYLDLFGDRGGEIGERPVNHVLGVLPRQPVSDQAAHEREQRKGSSEAPQQRAAQTIGGRLGHDRTRGKEATATRTVAS